MMHAKFFKALDLVHAGLASVLGREPTKAEMGGMMLGMGVAALFDSGEATLAEVIARVTELWPSKAVPS